MQCAWHENLVTIHYKLEKSINTSPVVMNYTFIHKNRFPSWHPPAQLERNIHHFLFKVLSFRQTPRTKNQGWHQSGHAIPIWQSCGWRAVWYVVKEPADPRKKLLFKLSAVEPKVNVASIRSHRIDYIVTWRPLTTWLDSIMKHTSCSHHEFKGGTERNFVGRDCLVLDTNATSIPRTLIHPKKWRIRNLCFHSTELHPSQGRIWLQCSLKCVWRTRAP